ncbi:MAG: phosphatidylinositol mannoside acyltransferase [Actinobacteria bacterium]|nr:phosphatidylinositol mannoside acyltransferase [Actinomycetota bacterium]
MKINYYLFFMMQKLIGVLPIGLSTRIAKFGGNVYYYLIRKKRLQAKRNIRRVLGDEASRKEIARTARKMCRYYAQYWIDILWVPTKTKEYILERFSIIDLENFDKAFAVGKGVLVVLPHFGSWEAGAVYLASRGKFSAVAEVLKPPELFQMFCDLREAVGITIFPYDHKPRTRMKMIEFLREGGMLALLADRDLKGNGLEVEFFGEKTTFPPGPAALAVKGESPIVCVNVMKNDDGTWTARATEPIMPDMNGDRREILQEMMQQVAYKLEDLIMDDPAQWHMLMPAWPKDRD